MEPERKIEKLLRAYAKKRRAGAGEPAKLHPAMRRILQDEVARIQRPDDSRTLSLWQLLRQEWAWLGGFALIIFFCAALLAPVLSSSKHKAQSVNAMTNLRLIHGALELAAGDNNGKLPASLDELTNELGKLPLDPRTGKPFIYVAGGETIDDLQTNNVLAYSPEGQDGRAVLFADGRIEMETPEQFAGETENIPTQLALQSRETANAEMPEATTVSAINSPAAAPITAPLSGAAQPDRDALSMNTISGAITNTAGGFGGFGGYGGHFQPATRPSGVTSVTSSSSSLSTQAVTYRNMAQQNMPVANSKTVLKMQNNVSQPSVSVLANFQLEQNGNDIRVVDGDGSVYAGSLLPANENRQNTSAQTVNSVVTFAPVQSNNKNNVQTPPGNFSFQVMGINRTARQNVVFDGNLSVASTLPVSQQSLSVSTRQLQPQPQPQQSPSLPTYHITGTATVGVTNQIKIDAVPAMQ